MYILCKHLVVAQVVGTPAYLGSIRDERRQGNEERRWRRIRTRRLHALLPWSAAQLSCHGRLLLVLHGGGIPFRALDARSVQEPAVLLVRAQCMEVGWKHCAERWVASHLLPIAIAVGSLGLLACSVCA